MTYEFPLLNTINQPRERTLRIHRDKKGRPLIYIDGAKFSLLTPETAYEMADALVDLAETIERNTQCP